MSPCPCPCNSLRRSPRNGRETSPPHRSASSPFAPTTSIPAPPPRASAPLRTCPLPRRAASACPPSPGSASACSPASAREERNAMTPTLGPSHTDWCSCSPNMGRTRARSDYRPCSHNHTNCPAARTYRALGQRAWPATLSCCRITTPSVPICTLRLKNVCLLVGRQWSLVSVGFYNSLCFLVSLWQITTCDRNWGFFSVSKSPYLSPSCTPLNTCSSPNLPSVTII